MWFYKHNVDNLILIVYKRQNWFQHYCIYLLEMSSSFFFLFKFFVNFCNFGSVLNLSPYMSTGSRFFLDLWRKFDSAIIFLFLLLVSACDGVKLQCNSFSFVHLSCLVLMILCGTTHLLFKCGNSSLTCMGQVDWRW